MNALEFEGGLNPILAPDWLTDMEKLFQVVSCSEKDKVNFTIHILQGPTVRWWVNA